MIEVNGQKFYSLAEVQATTGFKVGWNVETSEQLLMIMEGLGQVTHAAVPGEYPGSAYFSLSKERSLSIMVVNTSPAARRTYQYVHAQVGTQLLRDAVRNVETRAQVYSILKRSVAGLLTNRKPIEIPAGIDMRVSPIALKPLVKQ